MHFYKKKTLVNILENEKMFYKYYNNNNNNWIWNYSQLF